MRLINFRKEMPFRFIYFGIFNVLLSNLILQILLQYVNSIIATFFSQLVNFCLGYYLYGSKVFRFKLERINTFIKYLILVIFLWNSNWILIEIFHSFGISKNIIAIVIVPFLALISYLSQKNIVFKS